MSYEEPLTSLGALFEPIVSSANTVVRISLERKIELAGLYNSILHRVKKVQHEERKMASGWKLSAEPQHTGGKNTRGDENCIVQGFGARLPDWDIAESSTVTSSFSESESNKPGTEWQWGLFWALCMCECILFAKGDIFHTFASYSFPWVQL